MEGLEHFLSLRTQRSYRYTEKKQPNVGKKQQYISDKKNETIFFSCHGFCMVKTFKRQETSTVLSISISRFSNTKKCF